MKKDRSKIVAIRQVVRAYLDLIDSDDSLNPEEELGRLLDELAFRASRIDPTAPGAGPGPEPAIDSYEVVRKRVSARFPDLGMYNVASAVESKIGESDCMVGDAIDDITDIYRDLAEAESKWQNSTAQEAMSTLKFSFDTHWERHLRWLQVYLLARRSA